MLSIERGWLVLIDGLTIQRYFLHAFPWIINKLGEEQKPILTSDEMYSILIKYALTFSNKIGNQEISENSKTWLIIGNFDDDQKKHLDQALKLINISGLSFVVELGSAILSYDNNFYDEQLLCVTLYKTESPTQTAVRLLSKSAFSLSKVFFNSYKIECPFKEKVKISESIAKAFQAAIVTDFYHRCILPFDSLYLDAKTYLEKNRLETERALNLANHMNLDDLINLYLPNPSRFEKYSFGKGAGQL